MIWPPDSEPDSSRSPSCADDGQEMVNHSEETRQLRIARLKRQVDAGTYRVPAGEVADAMVRFFSREMPDQGGDLSPWSPR